MSVLRWIRERKRKRNRWEKGVKVQMKVQWILPVLV